jgi:hypothetical protein
MLHGPVSPWSIKAAYDMDGGSSLSVIPPVWAPQASPPLFRLDV